MYFRCHLNEQCSRPGLKQNKEGTYICVSPPTYACLFAPAWFVLQKEHWHACVSEYRYINKRSAEQSASRSVAQFKKLRFAHCKDMNWLRRGGGPRAAAATHEKNTTTTDDDDFWAILASRSGHFGITLGSFWGHLRVILGSTVLKPVGSFKMVIDVRRCFK